MGSYLDKLLLGLRALLNNGAPIPPRPNVNLIGFTVADDPGLNATDVTANAGVSGVAHTTAPFTQPAIGSTVSVTVDNTAMLSQGVTVYVLDSGLHGGWYTVQSVTDGTHFVAVNPGIPGNSAAATTVSSGALVTPSGPVGQLTSALVSTSGGVLVQTNFQTVVGFIALDLITCPPAPFVGVQYLYINDRFRSMATLSGGTAPNGPVTFQRGSSNYVIQDPDGRLNAGGTAPRTGNSVTGTTDGANYRFMLDGAGTFRCVSSSSAP